jgi:hypothetical protein
MQNDASFVPKPSLACVVAFSAENRKSTPDQVWGKLFRKMLSCDGTRDMCLFHAAATFAGGRVDRWALTMNSMAREEFHPYIERL